MKIWLKNLLIGALLVSALIPAARMFAANGYRTGGGQIYDASNNLVQLRGVNWFGFETETRVVHGLWARNWKEMIAQMKAANFNAVRLPFCPANLTNIAPTSIDYSKNPDLQGKSSLQVLDAVVNEFDRQGMYVLLDHHRPDCNAISELWYTNSYSEQQWISDLVFVANRYKNVTHFIGVDLKNEPHGSATWGTGNQSTDWNSAAERAAAQVLAAAPNILVFVEGIQTNPSCSNEQFGHFWGENLQPLACAPLNIPADKLVLSPHVYGPDVFDQAYFQTGDFPNNMPAIWNQHFGQFAPAYTLVPGEFGGKYGQGNPRDRVWQDAFVNYLISKNIRSGFYWSWNPNSGDTGGILQDDWQTVRQDKLTLLNRLWGGIVNPTPTVSPTAAPTPTATPTPTSTPTPNPGGGLSVVPTTTSDWGAGYCKDVRVTNNGSAPVDWTVRVAAPGNINDFWNGIYSRLNANEIEVGGNASNNILPAGASTSFGFCAQRTTAPTPSPTPTATPTPVPTPTATPTPLPTPTPNPGGALTTTVTRKSEWNTGYCDDVIVKNNTSSPIDWTVVFSTQGVINNLWNAAYTQNGRQVRAEGISWNNIVPPNGTVTFGFCANK